jgi:very-short-patch-repair endonuclease/predicted transcriptional regulator of viral defense system
LVGTSRHTPSGRAWSLAATQHGLVSRRQLLELGFSGRAIEHRVAKGRLHPVARGVYAVGRPGLTHSGRWMAAILACRSRAALSHRSAAELWGIGDELPGTIEIVLRSSAGLRQPGVRIYRRPAQQDREVVVRDGIPVTNLVRTFLDLVAYHGTAEVEKAINEADRRELIDPESLRAALDSYPGQRGVARLRDLLDLRTFRLTDSELERRFLSLVEAAGLALPATGRRLNGFKVDFFWAELGLVVETDGLRYHRTPAQQARDRLRDQAHTAAGLAHLRFTHAQVRFEPDHVLATLVATARGLGAEPRPSARRRSWRSAA